MFVQNFKDIYFMKMEDTYKHTYVNTNSLVVTFCFFMTLYLFQTVLLFIFSVYEEAAESLHQLADKLPAPGNLL